MLGFEKAGLFRTWPYLLPRASEVLNLGTPGIQKLICIRDSFSANDAEESAPGSMQHSRVRDDHEGRRLRDVTRGGCSGGSEITLVTTWQWTGDDVTAWSHLVYSQPSRARWWPLAPLCCQARVLLLEDLYVLKAMDVFKIYFPYTVVLSLNS